MQTVEKARHLAITAGMTEPASAQELFKGRHFDQEIIVLCVRWYLTFKLLFLHVFCSDDRILLGPVAAHLRSRRELLTTASDELSASGPFSAVASASAPATRVNNVPKRK